MEIHTILKEYKVNENIDIRLVMLKGKPKTLIFVENKPFIQCSYVLLGIDRDYELEEASIDGMLFNNSLEGIKDTYNILSPEEEFWVHCSSLQAWVENGYMSELLDRRIAFPLLKELAKKGDSKVKIIFNTEIIERIERGYLPVVAYLVENRYLDYLPKEYFEYFSVSEHLKEKILYKTITPENRKYWLIGMYFFEKLYPYMSSFDVKKYISLIKAYGLNPNLVQNILFEPQFISLCAVNPNRIMSLRKALIHDLILTKDYVKFKLDLYVLNSYLDHLNEI